MSAPAAPTIAQIFGLELPGAEGKPIVGISSSPRDRRSQTDPPRRFGPAKAGYYARHADWAEDWRSVRLQPDRVAPTLG
jgi:hypothetical protein